MAPTQPRPAGGTGSSDVAITPDPVYALADQLGARFAGDMLTFNVLTDRRAVLSLNPVKINMTDVRC